MIKRKDLENIKSWIWKSKILILKWARQVGKTTIMKEIENYIKDVLKESRVVFLQADKIDNSNLFSSPENLINYLKIQHNFPNNYVYLFIDEFQFIKEAGLFLKNIFDEYKDNLQIIVSGSSSLEISKNSEFLTWRAINFYIDRISFANYFNYKENIESPQKFELDNIEWMKVFYEIYKNKLEFHLLSYLNYWWYPEVLASTDNNDKKSIISQIIETYMQKDIIDFLKIENITAFNNLIKLLCSNIWNLININEISSTLNISMQTVNKYLDILEWTFVFSRVLPFFKNTRKEISKMPKIFVEDIGIKNFSLREFDSMGKKIDLWREVENFVYNELRKKLDKNQIYYYRTVSKAEIDFVIEKSYEKYDIIEVKYRNKVNLPIVVKNFGENYNVLKKIIITKDILTYENEIKYIPACLFPFMNF